jgi:NAD(P)-dependent dehydrogenase (short-subunit alcohol dehydrogenase family)/acyl carrier protein
VLGIVAEKTGYPRDMLDPDLDLEADLGIDTVKQAEVFAMVRETFNIPRQDNLKLRDYPTLRHVVGYVEQGHGASWMLGWPLLRLLPLQRFLPLPSSCRCPVPATAAPQGEIAKKVLAIVAEKTGYPSDMLELDLDLEADLGVDTVKQAEVFAMVRETFNIPRQDNLKLRDYPTLRHVIGYVEQGGVASAPGAASAPAPAPVAQPVATVAPTAPVVSVPAPAAPAAPKPAAAAAVASSDPIVVKVLAIVAEKTGYPSDMLELDLDLEADLGVDTVKQAEVFAMVREEFKIPRKDDLKLRDYPTLRHVIGYVNQSLSGGEAASRALPLLLLQHPHLRPPLRACSDGGSRGGGPSHRRVVRQPLRKRRASSSRGDPATSARCLQAHVCAPGEGQSRGRRGGSRRSRPPALRRARTARGSGPAHRRAARAQRNRECPARVGRRGPRRGHVLPRLARSLSLAERDRSGRVPQTVSRARVAPARGCARALRVRSPIQAPSSSRDCAWAAITATGQGGARNPLGGAVVGFVKATGRERPEMLVKAVDFPEDMPSEAVARALLDETERDPGAVEIGYQGNLRVTVGVQLFTAIPSDAKTPFPMDENAVFAVTGGAGAITVAIVRDLAAASRGTFYLLDARQMPPESERPLLEKVIKDREGAKRDVFERLKAEKGRATPAQVEEKLFDLERQAGILEALRSVEAAGGRAFYRQVDVLDGNAVKAVVENIRQQSGKLDVVLHAAGLERSRSLDRKPVEEFDLVFRVKADGLFNLMAATRDLDVKAMVVFSSVAGRFGNAGQADYSAGNDFMCKTVSWWAASRPNSLGIALDWTAWGGIGMATRGSIPEIMKRAGIDMLDPAEGLPVIRNALIAGYSGEAVVGRRLGILVTPFDKDGGLDVDGSSAGAGQGQVAALALHARETQSARRPGGRDEARSQGRALPPRPRHRRHPGSAGRDGHRDLRRSGLVARAQPPRGGLENLRFLAPMKYYRNEPRAAIVRARAVLGEAGRVRVFTTLSSVQTIVGREPEEKLHFSGVVVLEPSARKRASCRPSIAPSPRSGARPSTACTSTARPTACSTGSRARARTRSSVA